MRVLYVDDDPQSLEFMKVILEDNSILRVDTTMSRAREENIIGDIHIKRMDEYRGVNNSIIETINHTQAEKSVSPLFQNNEKMLYRFVKMVHSTDEFFNDKYRMQILHVDDDIDFVEISKQCLEMHGPFQVDIALSVDEAIEKMKNKRFDAVVCDYLMPGKNGLAFLKALREKSDTIPFIIFTGKGREETSIMALHLGANGYINKIGNPETVYSELTQCILHSVGSKQARGRCMRARSV